MLSGMLRVGTHYFRIGLGDVGQRKDFMVPVERIELPTFGLQNRCSTAELNRRIEAMAALRKRARFRSSSAARIPDLSAKGQRPCGCHCERREAIHLALKKVWIALSLCSRNDEKRIKGGLSAAFYVFSMGSPYWQRCRRPSSPRNTVPGTQTKPLRRAYSSPPSGAVAIAAAVPTAPPTTPAATSPGQKLSRPS
jgi:hypothetical protein